MAYWLRIFSGLAEDQNLLLDTYNKQLTTSCNAKSRESDTFYWTLTQLTLLNMLLVG